MKRLVWAALAVVAMLVPVAASAGAFEDLEQQVPASVLDADAINERMVSALNVDVDAVKAVQEECGYRPTGGLGPKTLACVKSHASAIAAARKHAAADLEKVEGDLADCNDRGDACGANLAAMKRERDEALAKARSGAGVGEEFGELAGICAKVDLSQFVGTCDPVSENVRCVTDAKAPFGFTLACVPKRVGGEVKSLVIRPDGSADAQFDLKPQKGTLPPAKLPWQVPPQPLPKPKGTCDGVGGKLLCYALPVAAATLAGLVIADAVSPSFNLVNVNR